MDCQLCHKQNTDCCCPWEYIRHWTSSSSGINFGFITIAYYINDINELTYNGNLRLYVNDLLLYQRITLVEDFTFVQMTFQP